MEASPPQPPPEAPQPLEAPQPPTGPYTYGEPGPGPYRYEPRQKGRGFPVWAIVLIVAVVLLPVMGILAAIAIPTFVMQQDKAKDSSAREGARSIQIGIQTWAVEHGDVCPEATEVAADGDVGASMNSYVGAWPTNPWTNQPMRQGSGEGDFGYSVTPNGWDYTLVVRLSDGEVYEIR